MGSPYSDLNRAEEEKFARRENDWRVGPVVYQVLVDRFAEPADLAGRRRFYPQPRKLKPWSELPAAGAYLPEYHVYSQELEFWGGTLQGLRAKLDYIEQLGVDVLYLNPIHSAFTNHKYDASDYLAVSPEYGTLEDLDGLVADVHRRGMRIVLDGVFNHMGRRSPIFQEAASNPGSPYRAWFDFSAEYSQGVRLWQNARNLPELNFENPAVRDFIYAGRDSVVRSFLRRGIDGWRLDTAFELGFEVLSELTECAHREKPGSLTVGEIVNYPGDWFPAADGVMNFMLREIILHTTSGKIDPAAANGFIAHMAADCGVEPLLKSWTFLDNHDVPRLATYLPDPHARRAAQVLQFTLPGSPNLYYGVELGMQGGADPAQRAPMRWDLVSDDNEDYRWTKQLIRLRRDFRALRVGDYRPVLSQKLVAFERFTNRAGDALVVLANPTGLPVEETVLVPDSLLMDATRMVDLLGSGLEFNFYTPAFEVAVPPRTALVLSPQTGPVDGYTSYKRVP